MNLRSQIGVQPVWLTGRFGPLSGRHDLLTSLLYDDDEKYRLVNLKSLGGGTQIPAIGLHWADFMLPATQFMWLTLVAPQVSSSRAQSNSTRDVRDGLGPHRRGFVTLARRRPPGIV